MTDQKHTKELLPCPFCGNTPNLPDWVGTVYEIKCNCGCSRTNGIRMIDLMTVEERLSCEELNLNNDFSFPSEYIERAKVESIKSWNTRPQLTAVTKQRDEAIKLCSDLIAENAGLKNSRDELRDELTKMQTFLAKLNLPEKDFMKWTETLDEHPEEYDGPCNCYLCLSYANY